MSWYHEAAKELADVALAVQRQQPLRIDRVEPLAVTLVSQLKQNDQLVVEALSGPAGSSLITNLVNVAILGSKIGIGLGYYGKELERLALAGLLHDIGLFAVPSSLISKAGRLTSDERALIEQHPVLGYQVIQRTGSEHQWLAQLVGEAHERFNGKGYPKRLKGREISEMAQILGAVDVFDALVSERPYRKRLLPHQAVRELLVVERATFPREILKALVEQLSVYPLGTTVRLTTGEVGTVVKVNPRYPLRPVVKIDDVMGTGSASTRQIDLSLTPLVSVVETLDAPSINKLTFPSVPIRTQATAQTIVASDNFSSLLESLDAIASAIQGVIETKIADQDQDLIASKGEGTEPDVWASGDVPFRKEVVGLFALEAREWLAQIETALKQLRTGVEGSARARLYRFILNGMTNLARSASTVQVSEIEVMASELLPLLRGIESSTVEKALETLRSLQTGLDRIALAVHRLAGVPPAPEPMAEERQTHESMEVEPQETPITNHQPSEPGHEVHGRVGSSIPLLKALRDLQQVRARTAQPARDMLEAVIARATIEVGEHNDNIEVESVERILRDLDQLDEEFLQEVNRRVPAMAGALMRLREEGISDFATASQFDPILVDVEALHDGAKTVNATTIMMFLQGLKSFLTGTAYKKVEALPQRLQALEERLVALIPMAQQWVSLGRIERASIEDILPV